MDGDWKLRVEKFLKLWADDTPMGKNVLLKFNEREEWKTKRFYDFDVDVRNFFMRHIEGCCCYGVIVLELTRCSDYGICVDMMDFTEYYDGEVAS